MTLESYKSKFYFMLTLGSPHLGLLDQQSGLVKTGFWIMANFIQHPSMVELALKDTQSPENSQIFALSRQNGLSWFKKLVLVASRQDDYVPFEIARIEQSSQLP